MLSPISMIFPFKYLDLSREYAWKKNYKSYLYIFVPRHQVDRSTN